MTLFSPVGLFHVAGAPHNMAAGFQGTNEDEHCRSLYCLFLLRYHCCTMLYKFQGYNIVFTFFKGYIPFVVFMKYWLFLLQLVSDASTLNIHRPFNSPYFGFICSGLLDFCYCHCHFYVLLLPVWFSFFLLNEVLSQLSQNFQASLKCSLTQ